MAWQGGGSGPRWGLRRHHVAAAAGLGLFFRVGGAVPRGPNPGLLARRPLVAPCAQPSTARPPRPGERGGAGGKGSLGRSGEGAQSLRRHSRPPPGRRPVKEKGAGSVGTWRGVLSCLLLGRRGKEWARGFRNSVSAESGNEAAAVQVQVLEL